MTLSTENERLVTTIWLDHGLSWVWECVGGETWRLVGRVRQCDVFPVDIGHSIVESQWYVVGAIFLGDNHHTATP